MRLAISKINHKNEQDIAKQLWADALSSKWESKPVWVHGDIAIGNFLVKNGRLNAVNVFN